MSMLKKQLTNLITLEYVLDKIEVGQSIWIEFRLKTEFTKRDGMIGGHGHSLVSNGKDIQLVKTRPLTIEYLEKYLKLVKEHRAVIKRTSKKYIRAIELLNNKKMDLFVGDHVKKPVHVPGSRLYEKKS